MSKTTAASCNEVHDKHYSDATLLIVAHIFMTPQGTA